MAKGMFNPQEHLINLKGKNYLQVAHRVAWFKTEHGDDGAITTDVLQTEPFPLVKAFISIAGVVIATGHGTAQVSNNAVYKGREIEKAETAAIGRALANAGYGTQFSEMLDDDSDDLADSPTQQRQPQAPKTTPVEPQTAKARALVWVNKNRLNADGVAMPTDDNNEVAWKTWCEAVKAKAS
jgi:hypothetical protein